MQIRKLFTCDGCGCERLDEHESRCDCMVEQGTWTESKILMLPKGMTLSDPYYQASDMHDDIWQDIDIERYQEYTAMGDISLRTLYAIWPELTP